MKKLHKEIARYVLLIVLMIGAYYIINSAYGLELQSKLTVQYAGVVGVYLGAWSFVIKHFFETTPSE